MNYSFKLSTFAIAIALWTAQTLPSDDSVSLKLKTEKSRSTKLASALTSLCSSLAGVGLLATGTAIGTFGRYGPNPIGHALIFVGAALSVVSVMHPTQETSSEEKDIAFFDNARKIVGIAGLVAAGGLWTHAYLQTPPMSTISEKFFQEMSQEYGEQVSNWKEAWNLIDRLNEAYFFSDLAPLYV